MKNSKSDIWDNFLAQYNLFVHHCLFTPSSVPSRHRMKQGEILFLAHTRSHNISITQNKCSKCQVMSISYLQPIYRYLKSNLKTTHYTVTLYMTLSCFLWQQNSVIIFLNNLGRGKIILRASVTYNCTLRLSMEALWTRNCDLSCSIQCNVTLVTSSSSYTAMSSNSLFPLKVLVLSLWYDASTQPVL